MPRAGGWSNPAMSSGSSLTHKDFNAPWAFGGPLPPTAGEPLRVALPGGPHGRSDGARSPLPGLALPAMAASRSRTGLNRIWEHAPSRWLPLRKKKRSWTATGYPNSRRQAPTSEYVRAALAVGPIDGTERGLPLPLSTRRAPPSNRPSSEYDRVARCDPGR